MHKDDNKISSIGDVNVVAFDFEGEHRKIVPNILGQNSNLYPSNAIKTTKYNM